MQSSRNPRALFLLLFVPMGILGLIAHIEARSWALALMFAVVTLGLVALAIGLWRCGGSEELEEGPQETFNSMAGHHVAGFFGLLALLVRFAAGSRQFLKRTSAEIALDSQGAPVLRRICRQIMATVVVGLAIGLVIVPTTPLWIGVPLYHLDPVEAQHRSLAFFMLSVIAFPMPIHWGIAVGCLLAPASFFKTVVGQSYQRIIGTPSLRRARIVCGILVLLVPALWVTFVVLFLNMASLTK